jgi:hypothetical protein
MLDMMDEDTLASLLENLNNADSPNSAHDIWTAFMEEHGDWNEENRPVLLKVAKALKDQGFFEDVALNKQSRDGLIELLTSLLFIDDQEHDQEQSGDLGNFLDDAVSEPRAHDDTNRIAKLEDTISGLSAQLAQLSAQISTKPAAPAGNLEQLGRSLASRNGPQLAPLKDFVGPSDNDGRRVLLRVKDRFAARIQSQIWSTFSSATHFVSAISWKKLRDEREATTIVRFLDLFNDQLGPQSLTQIDGIEVLLRRLAALQLANFNGHCQVASEIEEVPASNFIGGNAILAEAYKNASTRTKTSKLGGKKPSSEEQ